MEDRGDVRAHWKRAANSHLKANRPVGEFRVAIVRGERNAEVILIDAPILS